MKKEHLIDLTNNFILNYINYLFINIKFQINYKIIIQEKILLLNLKLEMKGSKEDLLITDLT